MPDPPAQLDLRVISATLRGGEASDAWMKAWLSVTFEAPGRFLEMLYAHVLSPRSGMKSRLGREYDLYHDCVLAHVERRAPALFAREGGEYTEISYAMLHQRCSALSAAWDSLGVERGQSVCVTLPLGVDYTVSLLTALRMGLVVSTLEPCGPSFVQNRLPALSPDWIVASERLRGALRLPRDRVLPPRAERDASGLASCRYAPNEVALRLLSSFGEVGTETTVTASSLHASLLRDGLFVFGLGPSDVLAAPGFDPTQAQPHLLLVALAAGACYAVIDEADLEANPEVAERAHISVLGVSNGLRDRLLARGAGWLGAAGRAWFRSLTEVYEMERWELLGRALADRRLDGFSVFMNAATGGVELWSPRSASPCGRSVWPAPGRTFQLFEVGAGGLPAINDAGVYTVMDGKEPATLPLPRLLLGRRGDGYVYSGALDLGRDAQVYPGAEVAWIAARLPGVRHAAVVLQPGRWLNEARVVLVVFVDDARGPDGRVAVPVTVGEVRAHLAREMGERFDPDRIDIFPLRPRLVGGEVDEGWCRSQYRSGALHAKARSETFLLLSRMRYILAEGSLNEPHRRQKW